MNHVSDPTSARYEFLDVARAMAAGMVFLEHTRRTAFPDWLVWPIAYFNVGFCGIVLFLVISGYIIPASLERGSSIGSFWFRRVFRLLPALYFSIALAAGYVLIAGPEHGLPPLDDIRSWLGNLILVPDLFHRTYTWGVFWSLRLEFLVYFVATALAATGLLRRAGAVALVLPAAILLLGVSRPLLGQSPYHPDSQRMACFVALIGLFAYRQHQLGRGSLGLGLLVAGLLSAGVLVNVLNVFCYRDFPFVQRTCCWLTSWGFALGIFWALAACRGRTMPAWASYLGRISYSIYLVHAFVLLLLTGWIESAAYLPLAIALTIALASLSYYAVESPGIRLGRTVEGWFWPKNKSKSKALPATPATRAA